MYGLEKVDRNKLGKELYDTMNDLVSFGYRYPGSKAEKKAASYILKKLNESGINAVYEEYEARCYKYTKQIVKLTQPGDDDLTFESHPVWLSKGGSVTGPVINIGYGIEPVEKWIDKVKGKIVVMRSKIFMTVFPTQLVNHIYRAVEDGGALGFVAWIDAPCGIRSRYDEIHEDHYTYGKIPGAILSREDGMMLDACINDMGDGAEITIESDGEVFWDKSGDIFAIIPGNEKVLAVQTHYDSTHWGAVDNAAANAAWIFAAKAIAKLEDDHPTVMLCGNSGHENCIGARHFMKRHADLIAKTYACINFDGLASTGYSWSERGVIPTGRDDLRFVHTSDNPMLLKMICEKLEKYKMLPANYAPLSTSIANEDLEGMFYDLKIPTLLVIGKRIWYHSDHDTPDKIEPEQMARAALCHLEMIMELLMMDSAELKKNDRRPHEEVVDAMIPENRTLREECGLDHGFTFNIIPETPKTGERVYMYQTSVVHDPGVIIDTVWDFGDNASPGKGQFTSHVYEKKGRYTVTVTVNDDKGNAIRYKRALWIK